MERLAKIQINLSTTRASTVIIAEPRTVPFGDIDILIILIIGDSSEPSIFLHAQHVGRSRSVEAVPQIPQISAFVSIAFLFQRHHSRRIYGQRRRSSNPKMGVAAKTDTDGDSESSHLLPPPASSPTNKVPRDSYHLAYLVYFTLGTGYLFPWNAFITAVDYFAYLYPDASVDRIFAVVYMLVGLVCLLFIVFYAHVSDAYVRINVGLAVFVVSLLVVPVMDVVYIKGQVGLYSGFYVTVGAVALSGVGDALVQGGIVGNAGELPERYMQATIAGTAASGVLVSLLRVFTKAVYSQDADGLRSSAILYFVVSISMMIVCIVFYNIAHRFPVIKYYQDLKARAVIEEKEDNASLGEPVWRSTLWEIVGRVKWYGAGLLVIYVVTLSIFPGYITEDVHSQILKDWYPILLISCYNVFDLVGKCITPLYMLQNSKIVIGGSFVRLLFLPLFYGCLHGPRLFRTEIPVTLLTCLLGLTNGYLTSVLMIMAPKSVQLQHSETAGIVMVLFLVLGLAAGSIVAWFWVI